MRGGNIIFADIYYTKRNYRILLRFKKVPLLGKEAGVPGRERDYLFKNDFFPGAAGPLVAVGLWGNTAGRTSLFVAVQHKSASFRRE